MTTKTQGIGEFWIENNWEDLFEVKNNKGKWAFLCTQTHYSRQFRYFQLVQFVDQLSKSVVDCVSNSRHCEKKEIRLG